MKSFIVVTSHDKGTIRLKVSAEASEKAIALVIKAEGCPRNAILETIEQLTVKCPNCRSFVWDVATVNQRLNKCHNCQLRFDNEEVR